MPKPTDEFDFSRQRWEHLIDSYIFSDRDREILKRRLLDGHTFEQLAAEFDLSTQHTKTIVYKAQDRLYRHIK